MQVTEMLKRKRMRFNILLAQNHMKESKESILAGFNAESTTELSEYNLDELIKWLESISVRKQTEVSGEVRKWRRKIFLALDACDVPANNYERVNAFLLDRRICGKLMYECTLDELKALHKKLRSVARVIEVKKGEQRNMTTNN